MLSEPVCLVQIADPEADTEEQVVDLKCSFNDNTEVDMAKFFKKLLANRTQSPERKSYSPKTQTAKQKSTW